MLSVMDNWSNGASGIICYDHVLKSAISAINTLWPSITVFEYCLKNLIIFLAEEHEIFFLIASINWSNSLQVFHTTKIDDCKANVESFISQQIVKARICDTILAPKILLKSDFLVWFSISVRKANFWIFCLFMTQFWIMIWLLWESSLEVTILCWYRKFAFG